MMITQKAMAGTMESSDVFVEIAPGDNGLSIEINSIVYNQFSHAIEATVRDVLSEFGVTNACVKINDRGAVDCAIRARVETAIRRGKGEV